MTRNELTVNVKLLNAARFPNPHDVRPLVYRARVIRRYNKLALNSKFHRVSVSVSRNEEALVI